MDKDESGSKLFSEYNKVRYQVLIDRLKSIKIEKPEQDMIYQFCDMLERKEFELDQEALKRFLMDYQLNLNDWLNIAPEDMAAKKKGEAMKEFDFRRHLKKKAGNVGGAKILNPEPVSRETFNYDRPTMEEGFNVNDYMVKVKDEQNKTVRTHKRVLDNFDSDVLDISDKNGRGKYSLSHSKKGKFMDTGPLVPILINNEEWAIQKNSFNINGPTGSIYPFNKYSGVGADQDSSDVDPNSMPNYRRGSMASLKGPDAGPGGADSEKTPPEYPKSPSKILIRGHTIGESGYGNRSKSTFSGMNRSPPGVPLQNDTNLCEKSGLDDSSGSQKSYKKTKTNIYGSGNNDSQESQHRSIDGIKSRSGISEKIIEEESMQGTPDLISRDIEGQIFDKKMTHLDDEPNRSN
jgi:hypothetical protein